MVDLHGLDTDGRWYGLARCSSQEYAHRVFRAEAEEGIYLAFRWVRVPGGTVLTDHEARLRGLPTTLAEVAV